MTLQSTDKFYIQRTDPSTGEELKLRSTISEIDTYVTLSFEAELDDLSDAIKEEAIIRENADTDLQEQLTGLSNRISDVGSEVFSVSVNEDYSYSVDTLCKNNYYIGVNTVCSGLTGQDFIDCNNLQLDTFTNCVASDPAEDSRGRFYLVSPDYTYENTTNILISDTTEGGRTVDWTSVEVGDFFKVIERTQDVNGDDRLNDFNYGFYKITGVNYTSYPEELDNTTSLYRLDVEYVSSSGRISTVDNNFKVQVMSDFANQVSDIYVAVDGDTMTGGLNIDIKDVNGDQDDVTGLVVKHTSELARLKLTGFSDTDTSTRLYFTGDQQCNILFDSSEFIISHSRTGIISSYSESGDALTYNKNVLFVEKASYVDVPNLSDDDNFVLVYKQYVDGRDDILAGSIKAVNDRVDTLANVVLAFKYELKYFVDCDPNGPNPPNPLPDFPAYNNSHGYSECVGDKMFTAQTDDNVTSTFNIQEFEQDYIDVGGNNSTRVMDVMTIQSQGFDLDSDQPISTDFENLTNVGDFVEMTAISGRNFAYRIYRIIGVQELVGKDCFRYDLIRLSTVGNVNAGLQFNIKFYDKTSGLTLEEVNDIFVRKDGDVMTGSLTFERPMFDQNSSDLESSDVITIRNPLEPSQKTFEVDSLGNAVLSSIELKAEDPAITSTKLTISDTINFGTNNGVFENVLGTEFIFTKGGNSKLTIGDSKIDVHNLQIRQVKDATLDSDAVNYGQLKNSLKGGDYITITESGGVSTIDWDNCNIGDLKNVSDDAPSINQVLRWKKKNNKTKWYPTTIDEFVPGDRVACTNESDLKVGGFMLSPNNDLYIRIS